MIIAVMAIVTWAFIMGLVLGRLWQGAKDEMWSISQIGADGDRCPVCEKFKQLGLQSSKLCEPRS